MMIYHVNSHPVVALRIVGIQPLLGRNNQLTSPDFGLVLVLDDETRHQWLCEPPNPTPQVDDFLVHDKVLNVVYVVAAAKFHELFQAVHSKE